jgi:hypothetical protein
MLDISGGTANNDFINYCNNCIPKTLRLKRNNGYKKIKTELACVEFGEKNIGGFITQYTHFYGEEKTK